MAWKSGHTDGGVYKPGEGKEEGEEKEEQEDGLRCGEKPKKESAARENKKRSKCSKDPVRIRTEKSTPITIPTPKKQTPWTNCAHCTNVNDIPEAWRKEFECEVPINILEGMFLLAAFTFLKFKIYDCHYLLFCKYL